MGLLSIVRYNPVLNTFERCAFRVEQTHEDIFRLDNCRRIWASRSWDGKRITFLLACILLEQRICWRFANLSVRCLAVSNRPLRAGLRDRCGTKKEIKRAPRLCKNSRCFLQLAYCWSVSTCLLPVSRTSIHTIEQTTLEPPWHNRVYAYSGTHPGPSMVVASCTNVASKAQ